MIPTRERERERFNTSDIAFTILLDIRPTVEAKIHRLQNIAVHYQDIVVCSLSFLFHFLLFEFLFSGIC